MKNSSWLHNFMMTLIIFVCDDIACLSWHELANSSPYSVFFFFITIRENGGFISLAFYFDHYTVCPLLRFLSALQSVLFFVLCPLFSLTSTSLYLCCIFEPLDLYLDVLYVYRLIFAVTLEGSPKNNGLNSQYSNRKTSIVFCCCWVVVFCKRCKLALLMYYPIVETEHYRWAHQ